MIGFCVHPQRGLQDLGVRYTPAEREAITHLWAWITFIMGAPQEFVPRSYAKATAWGDAALALDSGGIAESPELLHALLFHGLAFERVLPRPAAALARTMTGHALGACARRWMGEERADEINAPNTPLKHLVPLLRPAIRARDTLRATGLLGSDDRLVRLELALTERAMRAAGTPTTQIQPEHVEQHPVLATA
jgi:hypothetical protein